MRGLPAAQKHGRAMCQPGTRAMDAAQLAIKEYHNGDREWAEAWLLKAMAANKAK